MGGIETEWLLLTASEKKRCNFRGNLSTWREFDICRIRDGCIQPGIKIGSYPWTLGSELMRGCNGQRVGRISACAASGNRIELPVRSRIELKDLQVAVAAGTVRT